MSMGNSANPGPRLPWAGKPVRIEQVESELSFLWKLSADNVRTSQNINVRTSVLNLVICAPDVESAQNTSKILRDLSSTHIARVTIVILNRSVPPALFTWVTLRSFPIISDVMRHNFEQITVMASGDAVHAIANILRPLLKPDLPVYLWWLGDPPDDNRLFSDITQLSSRFIVDSSSFFTPEESIRTLASLLEASPQCALSDLNWGRVTPWRQLIAQFFDVAEYKPYLAGVDHIEIAHAAMPFADHTHTRMVEGDISPNPTRALMLAAWLKNRLGWKQADEIVQNQQNPDTGAYTWHMVRATGALTRSTGPLTTRSPGASTRSARGTRSATISIHQEILSDMRPGAISLVRLISQVEGKRAAFTVSRGDDPDHVSTSVELAEGMRLQRTVSITATHKESELLHDELEIMGRDYSYEETLQEVAALIE